MEFKTRKDRKDYYLKTMNKELGILRSKNKKTENLKITYDISKLPVSSSKQFNYDRGILDLDNEIDEIVKSLESIYRT